MKYKYYHDRINNTLAFIIPKNKRVLFMGSFKGEALNFLAPSVGVGVEQEKKWFTLAQEKYKKLKFYNTPYDSFQSNLKFDYIVLSGTLGKSKDMLKLLSNIKKFSRPGTRILIYQHNYLWQWLLASLEKLNFKRVEGVQNWLSVSDVRTYLEGAGFDVTRVFRKTISPIYFFGIGELMNLLSAIVPVLDLFKLDQYIIARPNPSLFQTIRSKSLTICLTVRNEKGNIERIVKSVPNITKNQEILFVEGHSNDGTREEIEKVIKSYPDKNIKVMGQPGKGQGDAIRVGFNKAKGDIIVLYEGDGTSDIGDIQYFYDAMATGRFEFIEGSRFVYPLVSEAMPFANKIGNIFFAKWFSFFLGQKSTDVLSGIKAILKRDYEVLYTRWGFLGLSDPFGDFELLYGAARLGLKIGEVPMRYYPRVYGNSKTNLYTHGLFLLRMAAKGYWLFRKS